MKEKNTYYIAVGGVVSALSVVIMFLTGLVPNATMALPGLAGALLLAVVIEMGPKWAVLIFVAVSILSALLAPDKEAVLFYAAFFGYYPIVKRFFEGIPFRWLQWLCKIALFNVCMAGIYAVVVFVFGLPEQFASPLYFAGVIVLLEAVFFLYDYCLTKLAALYVNKIRKSFKF